MSVGQAEVMANTEGGFVEVLRGAFASGARARIGFGTAHLYGGRQRAASLHLIETALDAGITYFDTARLYGHGQAEGLLGTLTAAKRDRLVLASKAGILPVTPSLAGRAGAKSLHLARRLPGLAKLVPAPTPLRPEFGKFTPVDLRTSVETSLKALATDHLDILLLHECEPAQARDPEVLDLMSRLQAEGKIRAFGTATQPGTSLDIARNRPAGLDIIQFKSDFTDATLADAQALLRDGLIVTHSHLGPPFRAFLDFVAAHQNRFAGEIETLGAAPAERDAWGGLLLAQALSANSDGVVLFSSSRPENIRRAAMLSPLEEVPSAALAKMISAFKAGQAAATG